MISNDQNAAEGAWLMLQHGRTSQKRAHLFSFTTILAAQSRNNYRKKIPGIVDHKELEASAEGRPTHGFVVVTVDLDNKTQYTCTKPLYHY